MPHRSWPRLAQTNLGSINLQQILATRAKCRYVQTNKVYNGVLVRGLGLLLAT